MLLLPTTFNGMIAFDDDAGDNKQWTLIAMEWKAGPQGVSLQCVCVVIKSAGLRPSAL